MAARAKGLPSESRQMAHRSPGCITEPPSSRTRSSVVARSATVKEGREAVSPGPGPRSWTPRRRPSVSVCHPDPAAAGRGSRVTPSTPCQNRRARSGSSAGNSISGAGMGEVWPAFALASPLRNERIWVRSSFRGGVDDLGAVYSLESDRGGAEVAVAELCPLEQVALGDQLPRWQARESGALHGHVRLVGIASVECELPEVAARALPGEGEHLLEAQHPGEGLRSVADRGIEAATELALADPQLLRDLAHRRRMGV